MTTLPLILPEDPNWLPLSDNVEQAREKVAASYLNSQEPIYMVCPHTGTQYLTTGPWDPEEETVARLLMQDGYPIKYAAEVLDRSYGAVYLKVKKMAARGLFDLSSTREQVREYIPVSSYLSHPEFKRER